MSQKIKNFFKKNRNWIITTCIVLYLCIIWFIPEQYVFYFFKFPQDKDKLDAIKDIRILLVNIGAGILALIGIYLTWRRTEALDKKNEIDKTNNENNLILQQFSKASELFTNTDNIAARLSGIYLFEKIMNNNVEYHWQIVELLTAYLREKRNNHKYDVEISKKSDHQNIINDEDTDTDYYTIIVDFDVDENDEVHEITKSYYRVPIEKDIQAIITILGRRNRKIELDIDTGKRIEELYSEFLSAVKKKDDREIKRKRRILDNLKTIDLSNVNLYGADLSNTHFEHSHCFSTHFVKSNCFAAHFEMSAFYDSHFENSYCKEIHFENTYFNQTHFENADLEKAFFKTTNLISSYFQNASCYKTYFTDTILNEVNFENGSFGKASFKNSLCYNCKFENTEELEAFQLSRLKKLKDVSGLTDEMKQEIIIFNPKLKNNLLGLDVITVDNEVSDKLN